MWCMSRARVIEGDVHDCERARCRRVDRRHDSVYMAMHGRALGIAKDHDRDPAASRVLLVLDVLIGGEEEIEASFFRRA